VGEGMVRFVERSNNEMAEFVMRRRTLFRSLVLVNKLNPSVIVDFLIGAVLLVLYSLLLVENAVATTHVSQTRIALWSAGGQVVSQQ
jgi:hypothetical protein